MIVLVTTDGYQSTNIRQDLKLAGFDTELLSVDRKKDPYLYLRNSIYEGRWTGPMHELLAEELLDVEDIGKKYDHSMHGSKDGADAVCGSIYAAFSNLEKYNTMTAIEDYAKVLDDVANHGADNHYLRILKNMN